MTEPVATNEWVDRILKDFTPGLSKLWIAADPDEVLLDERVLSRLRERGFGLMPFEDSIVFRADYEERYRARWDAGDSGPPTALILQLRGTDTSRLPWDYLSRARQVSVSLAHLFPQLSYAVVRQLSPEDYEALYAAQARHATQSLGDTATKEFVLTHIFRVSPHLISRPEELWRELLRLHYRNSAMPTMFGDHVAQVLRANPQFRGLPLSELFCSRSTLLHLVQDAWYLYLSKLGITGTRTGEPLPSTSAGDVNVPFDHPDVRAIIDSMFLDGLLHPLAIHGSLPKIPDWAKLGIVQDPLAEPSGRWH